jgi:hypothetical protein
MRDGEGELAARRQDATNGPDTGLEVRHVVEGESSGDPLRRTVAESCQGGAVIYHVGGSARRSVFDRSRVFDEALRRVNANGGRATRGYGARDDPLATSKINDTGARHILRQGCQESITGEVVHR